MTDPESVSGNGAEGGDSALKESGLSIVPGAQCETGVEAAKSLPNGKPKHSATPDFAPTRRGMPATSYKAAASVKIANLGPVKDGIIEILKDHGPQTDEYIAAVYAARVSKGMYPKHSPSGLRTRRSWLVDQGLVCDSGQRAKTQSGRESIVWRVK